MKQSILKIILLSLLIPLMVGCSKDETSAPEGTLKVTFSNPPNIKQYQLEIEIYSLIDKTRTIVEEKVTDNREIEVTLNIGDYIIQPYTIPTTSDIFFGGRAFQIRQGKTTKINY
jgi:uncharacterized secreted protein with C-terminal beta-propeller domain